MFYGVDLSENMVVPKSFVGPFIKFLGPSGMTLTRRDLPVIESGRGHAKTDELRAVWHKLYALVRTHGKIKVWLEV